MPLLLGYRLVGLLQAYRDRTDGHAPHCRLEAARLYVRDLIRDGKYYTDLLGLSIVAETNSSLALAGTEGRIPLVVLQAASAYKSSPPGFIVQPGAVELDLSLGLINPALRKDGREDGYLLSDLFEEDEARTIWVRAPSGQMLRIYHAGLGDVFEKKQSGSG
jgi:hypothetical protein